MEGCPFEFQGMIASERVFALPHQGVINFTKMDPDLVSPPGQWGNLNYGKFFSSFDRSVTGNGQFSPASPGKSLLAEILDLAFNFSHGMFEPAMDERDIFLPHAPAVKSIHHQLLVTLALCKDNGPGCVAVQSVAGMQPPLFGELAILGIDYIDQRMFLILRRWDHQDPGRFLKDNIAVIFV